MRKAVAQLFSSLYRNERNWIVFYSGHVRHRKLWKEFAADVDSFAGRLQRLRGEWDIRDVGILGHISYEWALLDLACMKLGLRSVALPEHLPAAEIERLLANHPVDLLLVDGSLGDRLGRLHARQLHYRQGTAERLEDVPAALVPPIAAETILEEYSLAFSSGTSEEIKTIPLRFLAATGDAAARPWSAAVLKERLRRYLLYRQSFWGRKDNRLILFMPFSHPQQRSLLLTALMHRVNIILSDPLNALKHIIIEKPNAMVSVPSLYELLARRIEKELRLLPPLKKALCRKFNAWGINAWSNRNPVKRIFSYFLFRKIRKIYGGRADYFVTGSAPIDPSALRSFYKVGVKIYEGYGQSELGVIALNDEKNFRIGSVGKPRVGVRIGADSEVLVRFDERLHSTGCVRVDERGFIHTGDLGYMDEDGFLYIRGRLDEVIVLRNGKKVFPTEIEAKLKAHAHLQDALVLSRDGVGLQAILCLKTPAAPEGDATVAALLTELNKTLLAHERIREYLVITESFTVANGLLTNTLKMRRKAIKRRYAAAAFQPLVPAGRIEEDAPRLGR